jgi:hypothetical protein
MTLEQQNEFTKRINSVTAEDKPLFGKMNVFQMICHCADQFRIMFAEFEGLKRQNVDVVKLREMVIRNETVPTVDGLDQAAGGGTKPTQLQNDKEILIAYLNRFTKTGDNYIFSFHPYYGDINKATWEKLVIHHMDHHLKQFGK